MLRPAIRKLLVQYIQKVAFLSLIPSLHWNPEKETLSQSHSSKIKFIRVISMGLELVFIGIVALSAPQIILHYADRISSLVIILLSYICLSSLPALQIGSAVYRTELIDFTNAFLRMEEAMS